MKQSANRGAVRSALTLFATLGIAFPTSAQTPKSYTVTTFSGLPSDPFNGTPFNSSLAYAINKGGTMAGFSYLAFATSFGTELLPRGVSWDSTGAITDVFGPLLPAPTFFGHVQSINDANVMVGVLNEVVAANTYRVQATLFAPSGITPLQSGFVRQCQEDQQQQSNGRLL